VLVQDEPPGWINTANLTARRAVAWASQPSLFAQSLSERLAEPFGDHALGGRFDVSGAETVRDHGRPRNYTHRRKTDVRLSGHCIKMVENENPNGGREIAVPPRSIKRSDEVRYRHLTTARDLLEARPEGTLKADACLVTAYDDRAFFHY
jgi:hypothetical protein